MKPFSGIFHGFSKLLYMLFLRQDYPQCLLVSANQLKLEVTEAFSFFCFERKKEYIKRQTWTTSSKPLASFKRRLFFVCRTLATTKTASVLRCCSLFPLFMYFLSNLPYRFSNLGSDAAALFRFSSSSYVANIVGLYSIAHISWNNNPSHIILTTQQQQTREKHNNHTTRSCRLQKQSQQVKPWTKQKKCRELNMNKQCYYLPKVQSVKEGEFSPEKYHQHPNSKQILPTIEILCHVKMC